MDPIAARPLVPLRPVPGPVMEPAPLPPVAGAVNRLPVGGAAGGEPAPALPVSLQRQQMRPPAPPLMTEEQMVALLSAAIHGPPPVHVLLDLTEAPAS